MMQLESVSRMMVSRKEYEEIGRDILDHRERAKERSKIVNDKCI